VLQQRKQPQQMGLLTQILCCGLLMTWSWVEMVSTRIMAERCLKVQKDDLSDFARWTLASSGTFTFFCIFHLLARSALDICWSLSAWAVRGQGYLRFSISKNQAVIVHNKPLI
jgi:hypothetical protein